MNYTAQLKTFSANVRARRVATGISQVAFAARVGVSKQQMSNIEKANNWPSMPVFIATCEALNAGKVPMVDSP